MQTERPASETIQTMKTINPTELATMIEATSGPLRKLAAQSRSTQDADGCHPRIKAMEGVAVGWVSNPRYCGGKINGYGAGLYAYIRSCGSAVQSVKLLSA